MNYQQAIELALEGNEKGFEFLYQKTYTDKFYVAKKYMKSDAEAEDILQEAYIKAFSKLDTLHKPESFPSWLGQIVANTAKNALAKNNPILFSDMNSEADKKEQWEDNIEEDKIEKLPEEAYTQKETQEIVQELLDSLSDEQRLCMMMFYLEEQSIKEIAEALECSENTVKSRLNYGRKNIKAKAEAMEKKGYKFYSITPVALLFAFLHTDMEAYAATAVPTTTCANITNKVVGKETVAKGVAKEGIKQGVKQGFLHTVAGKVVVAVAGIAVIGGVATGVAKINQNNNSNSASDSTAAISPVVKDNEWIEVTDSDYEKILAGGITKDDLTVLLACGPETMSDGIVDNDSMANIFILNNSNDKTFDKIEVIAKDLANGEINYSLNSVNNLFLVYGDNIFSPGFRGMGVTADDKQVKVALVTCPYSYEGEITSAKYNDKEMIVEYNVRYHHQCTGEGSEADANYKRRATLEKKDSGFQIKKIESSIDGIPLWKSLYRNILEFTLDNDALYRKSLGEWGSTANISYRYTLLNLDADDIPELLVEIDEDNWATAYIYQYDSNTKTAWKCTKSVSEGVASAGGSRGFLSVLDPGNEIQEYYWLSGSGQAYVTRYRVENGELVETMKEEFQMDSPEAAAFQQKDHTQKIEWHELNDTQLLDE